MARKTNVLQPLPDRDQAQELMKIYAKASVEHRKQKALMDAEINKVREKYESKIEAAKTDMDACFLQLQAWAMANRETEFSRRKSQDWTFGKIGFKLHPHKVSTQKGYNWRVVIDLLRKHQLEDYVAVKVSETPNKDLMLSAINDDQRRQALEQCGITFEQDEQFFVDPKEDVE